MGADLRHFNGLTKVSQSHCSALLSQMWMRPLQPPHPKQRKQTSLIHNVNMQVYPSIFHLLASPQWALLCFRSTATTERFCIFLTHAFSVNLPHIYFMYLTCSNLHNHSFTVTQRGPPAFCSEKGLERNHNIPTKNTKKKEKLLLTAQHCSSSTHSTHTKVEPPYCDHILNMLLK